MLFGPPQRQTVEKIQIHIDACPRPERAPVLEDPFSAGVAPLWLALHRKRYAAVDALEGFLEALSLGFHCLHIRGPDVVQVDVHGEARYVESKKVQRRPTLEDDSRGEETVLANGPQERKERRDPLQSIRGEAGRRGGLFERLARRSVGYDHSLRTMSSTASGTMRFHRPRSRPGVRSPRSR